MDKVNLGSVMEQAITRVTRNRSEKSRRFL